MSVAHDDIGTPDLDRELSISVSVQITGIEPEQVVVVQVVDDSQEPAAKLTRVRDGESPRPLGDESETALSQSPHIDVMLNTCQSI
jgi:hypothetical protein